MRHSQMNTWIGDLIAPVQMQQVNSRNGRSSQVARTRIGLVDEKPGQNGQPPQLNRSSFQLEGWNETAQRLASIPVGHTVIVTGKIQNDKYTDQNGQEKWSTKFVAFSVATAGPSQYPLPQPGGQNAVAPNYGQAPQAGYGQAPQGFQQGQQMPPQGYPQQQQQAPRQQQQMPIGAPAGAPPATWPPQQGPVAGMAPGAPPQRIGDQIAAGQFPMGTEDDVPF